MGGEHCFWRIYFLIYSVVCFVLVLVFNGIGGPGIGIFEHSTGNVSDKYDTGITPAGWTFSIWGVIYTGLALMWVYLVAGLCRRNEFGYWYCKPAILPNWWFGIWGMNAGLNIGWLVVWDRSYDNKWLLIAAMALLFLIAFSNYVLIGVSAKSLALFGPWLNKHHRADLWLRRILIENSLGLYATWTSIASLLNLAGVLIYLGGMSKEDAATVALSILLVEAIVWYILENTVLDRYVRFLLTPWPVVIVALAGSLSKNYGASGGASRNDIFTAVILGLVCVLFAIRIALTVWRQAKKPIYTGEEEIGDVLNLRKCKPCVKWCSKSDNEADKIQPL